MKNIEKEAVIKELSELGSTLDPRNKEETFTTPDGYFDALPSRIQERISGKTATARSFSTSFSVIRPAFAAAAAIFLVVLSLGIYLLKDGKENGQLAETWVDDELFGELYDDVFLLYADTDLYFIYNMVIESDLTTDEILFGITYEDTMLEHDALFDYVDNVVDYYGWDADMVLPRDN